MNNGYNPLAPIGQYLGNAWNSIKNAFTSAGGQTNYVNPGYQAFYSPGAPQFYQVKKEDTSMADVASSLGMPLPQLVAANNGTMSLPPAGSYIQTAPTSSLQTVVPPAPASSLPAGGGGANEGRGNPGIQMFMDMGQQITQLIAAGQTPTNIPAGALHFIRNAQGQPLTPQILIASGFVFNPQTNSYQLPGATGPGTGGNNPNAGKVYYSRARGWVTPEVARLLNKRKVRMRAVRQAKVTRGLGQPTTTATPEPTTTATPETILDIHLGSG